MDVTSEIKARLPIEELVGQYCQLQKKGRGFMCICPFHNDTKPSMQVSPDKGIAYCFACQSGGDIFSFYQLIEGVDFRQSLKDLADRTGVEVPDAPSVSKTTKDEKTRMRECLEEVQSFYAQQFSKNTSAQEYLKKRGIPQKQITLFGLGCAPDSFSATYDHLLKAGFSKSEILGAGMAIQKDLNGKIYDRFRNRLMFPIHNGQGHIVGFGGRTLGDDDAKYINSSDGPLYHKSEVLYGLHYAKEQMRSSKTVIMVEGYFDVLACHRVGVTNVIAVSGTALTEQHVKILKRSCETVVLCLDQDRAGQEAAERAFVLCSREGLLVKAVALPQKDPDEALAADPEGFKKALEEGGEAYMEHVFTQIQATDIGSIEGKRNALARIVPLLDSVTTSVEKQHYMQRAASVLQTTEASLLEDLEQFTANQLRTHVAQDTQQQEGAQKDGHLFSKLEVALGLFVLYPNCREVLDELIEPDEPFALALYTALKDAPADGNITLEMLSLPDVHNERASILLLYLEHHGLGMWSDSMAQHEIRKNCKNANRDSIRDKLLSISQKLKQARIAGKTAEAKQLDTQYQQVLKLANQAR